MDSFVLKTEPVEDGESKERSENETDFTNKINSIKTEPPDVIKKEVSVVCGQEFKQEPLIGFGLNTSVENETVYIKTEPAHEEFRVVEGSSQEEEKEEEEDTSGPNISSEDKESNEAETKEHNQSNETVEKPQKQQFQCSVCERLLASRGSLSRHKKIHETKRSYVCTTCGKGFNNNTNLLNHKEWTHVDPKDWKHVCQHCNKRFPIKDRLHQHVVRHMGQEKTQCDLCKRTFNNSVELKAHQRSHLGIKCQLCSMVFSTVSSLVRHTKTQHLK